MADQAKKVVVIVDDDVDLLRLVGTSFRSSGYEVVELKTGIEAKTYLFNQEQAAKVALLVLDRILPDTDGLEILKDLQKKYNPLFPVLILSSLSSEKDVLEGLTGGAVDYITKPFNMNILMQKAKQLLK